MADLILNGRKFVPIKTSTFEHDLEAMRLIRMVGLNKMAILPGETSDAFADRIVEAAAQSEYLLPLLACVIIPEEIGPENWTPQVHKDISHFFAALTSDADKKTLMSELGSLLAGFFLKGLAASKTSQNSLMDAAAQDSVSEVPISSENGAR